jgi:hypothetical protein
MNAIARAVNVGGLVLGLVGLAACSGAPQSPGEETGATQEALTSTSTFFKDCSQAATTGTCLVCTRTPSTNWICSEQMLAEDVSQRGARSRPRTASKRSSRASSFVSPRKNWNHRPS